MSTSRFLFFILSFLFSFSFSSLHAQDNATYIGVWRSGASTEYLKGGASTIGSTKPNVRGNMSLIQHEVRIQNSRVLHYGLWKAGSRREITGNWQKISDFAKTAGNSSGRGMNLITQIECYQHSVRPTFNVIYRTGKKQKQILERSASWNQFVSQWKQRLKQNMRLKRVIVYEDGGKYYFVGLYHEGTHGHYMYHLTGYSSFVKKWEELGKKNYRLVDVETYRSADGKWQYVGIWEPGKDGYVLWRAKGFNNFMKKFNELKGKMRLVDFEILYDKKAHLRTRYD